MQPVIHDMVIAHLADGIGAALAAQVDRDDHVFRVDAGLLDGDVARLSEWVEHHLFIRIDPCRNDCEESDPHRRTQQKQPRDQARATPGKERADRDEEKEPKQNWFVMERYPKGVLQGGQVFARERGELHRWEKAIRPARRG